MADLRQLFCFLNRGWLTGKISPLIPLRASSEYHPTSSLLFDYAQGTDEELQFGSKSLSRLQQAQESGSQGVQSQEEQLSQMPQLKSFGGSSPKDRKRKYQRQ